MIRRVLMVLVLVFAGSTAPPAQADSDSVPLANWMGTLPGVADRPLAEIPLPGTHDSATSTLSATSPWSEAGRQDFGDAALAVIPKAAAAAWSKAQPTSVGQQLRDGIRYLDLRLTQEPDGHLYLEHGLRGPLARDVLGEIGDFARTHPHEVVVVALNRFTAVTDQGFTSLTTSIGDAFGDRLVPASTGVRVTPRQLWEIDRNVVLIDQSGRLDAFGPGVVEAPWPNTADPAALVEAGRRNLAARDQGKLFVLGTALTPDANAIAGGVFRGVTSLADLARRDSHAPVAEWLHGLAAGSRLNIVTTDWYTNPMCGTSYVRLILSRVDGRAVAEAPCDVRRTGAGTWWSGADWSVHTWVDLAWTPVPSASSYEVSLRPVAGGGCQRGTSAVSSSASVRVDRQNVAWAEYLCLGSLYDVSVRAAVGGVWLTWSSARRLSL